MKRNFSKLSQIQLLFSSLFKFKKKGTNSRFTLDHIYSHNLKSYENPNIKMSAGCKTYLKRRKNRRKESFNESQISRKKFN